MLEEANTLSTLHKIAHCIKTGQYEKMFLEQMTAYRVTLSYFQAGFRILFTTFLETKTQLWKLMWAFLGCYIGSSGSPLHPPLIYIFQFEYFVLCSFVLYSMFFFFYQVIQFKLDKQTRAYNIEIKNIKINHYTCTVPYEPFQKS